MGRNLYYDFLFCNSVFSISITRTKQIVNGFKNLLIVNRRYWYLFVLWQWIWLLWKRLWHLWQWIWKLWHGLQQLWTQLALRNGRIKQFTSLQGEQAIQVIKLTERVQIDKWTDRDIKDINIICLHITSVKNCLVNRICCARLWVRLNDARYGYNYKLI